MATVTCSFVIPAGAANGGKLTGGFPANGKTVNNGDTLVVVTQWSGQGAPATLNGHFIISAAANATQSAPSPFLDGSRFVCYQMQQASKDTSNPPKYAFQGLPYGGGQPGQYELTFVAEYVDNTGAKTQWSEDPEFDTGS